MPNWAKKRLNNFKLLRLFCRTLTRAGATGSRGWQKTVRGGAATRR